MACEKINETQTCGGFDGKSLLADDITVGGKVLTKGRFIVDIRDPGY
jgi:hypothetical protein